MMNLVNKLIREEEGQGMAEYALILALVAIVVIGGLTILGNKVSNKMNNVGSAL